ncbi:MAG: redoxin domain-containing protein [Caulobacteraceae bacterium]|nr:MAG: redoxin domain-containing protein [Caulobacteraceae bacterium]
MTLTRRSILSAGLALPVLGMPSLALAMPAADFAVKDTDGKVRTLAEFRGRIVVLEWLNRACPYTQKHYHGNMQGLQVSATRDGAVWLSVCSSARGQPGYWSDGAKARRWMEKNGSAATALLLDADGSMGRAFGAKVTPHMYVIDKAGALAYKGAIDDMASSKVDDIKRARNLVAAALADVHAGRPVATPLTPAYGCGIKYG